MTVARIALAFVSAFVAGSASAAEIENAGAKVEKVSVTEGGGRSEIVLSAGESVEFCASGCFVTFANGDIAALDGSETVRIVGGAGRILSSE